MTEAITDEEKMNEVKLDVIKDFNVIYMRLVDFVSKTPIHEDIKKHAMMNLNQGAMWFGQGMKALTFNVQQPNTSECEDGA